MKNEVESIDVSPSCVGGVTSSSVSMQIDRKESNVRNTEIPANSNEEHDVLTGGVPTPSTSKISTGKEATIPLKGTTSKAEFMSAVPKISGKAKAPTLTSHPGVGENILANQTDSIHYVSKGNDTRIANAKSSTRQLKVEDALAYLDKVKTQFVNSPSVYNKFLEIMKNFKAQTIDTPGVIQRVSDLFKGHDNLILGFNTFLPPGFKIEVQKATIKPQKSKQPLTKSKRSLQKKKDRRTKTSAPSDSSSSARMQGQPIEFDHAIKYVTKIKQRFCHDAETYKKFLDILHTYQNEDNTIKEVLNDVSNLFRNHVDLLNEFTFFLPDNVRQKAKLEIKRLSNKNRKVTSKLNSPGTIPKRVFSPSTHTAKVPAMERLLFGRIRSALSSPQLYVEFLKCINLYSQQILSRSEMISLMCDLLGDNHILLEEFDRLLACRGATNNALEDSWFCMPTSEIDFTKCRRCTPSYRSLPISYPKPPCSERTAACRSVLNDNWVSVPTGSEDFNFKNMRKNEYEERLFKVEDDRYEIDIIIDCNKSTIRVLQYLENQLNKVTSYTDHNVQIDKRTLSVIHLKSIARIYGQHGMEVLELLRKNPVGSIPIILQRLKEKDVEWSRSRLQLNDSWKVTMEKNFFKSLDHRSLTFKQLDRKESNLRNYLQDLEEKYKQIFHVENAPQFNADGVKLHNIQKDSEIENFVHMSHANSKTLSLSFKLMMNDMLVHRDMKCILLNCAKKAFCGDGKNSARNEYSRSLFLVNQLVHNLMHLPDAWTNVGENYFEKEIDRNEGSTFKINSTVMTQCGIGTVIDEMNKDGLVCVQLQNHSESIYFYPGDIEEMSSETKCSSIGEIGVSYYTDVHTFFFLRLYVILFQRLSVAKKKFGDGRYLGSKDTVSHAINRDSTNSSPQIRVRSVTDILINDALKSSAIVFRKYNTLLRSIVNLVEGTIDGSGFQQECRALLGTHAYFLTTVEKVLANLVKQMQHVCCNNLHKESAETVARVLSYVRDMDLRKLSQIHKSNFKCLISDPGVEFCFKISYGMGILNGRESYYEKVGKKPETSLRKPVNASFFLNVEIIHGYSVPTLAALKVS